VRILDTPGGTGALGPMTMDIKFAVAVGWRKITNYINSQQYGNVEFCS